MKTDDLTTTISAGRFKGKKLKLPSLQTTRSTKSIVKESLFNTLQQEIIDEVFVEVFGGSGSMGLEALSRGAKHAYFIEKDKKAFLTLRENCKNIFQDGCTCIQGDSFKALEDLLPSLPKPAYFYLDPPFCIREGMQSIYKDTISLIEKIPTAKAIIVEHLSTEALPEKIAHYMLKKSRKFGKTTLSYYL
ncbi:MAG: 16S rRNA (guanine(966)-N(2))-methyltransferase RsmD [Sulfurospirillaceae bacterium]|nr:16S rRNA (guanine(966)-N(2))-methyltransferase RsmD [Sulfurospirillaceae bacterium]